MIRCCRSFLAVAACLGLVFLASGCGSAVPAIVPAEGVVLIDDEPLPGAKVRFYPQFENARDHIAQGVTDENGHFTLTCNGQSGACVGDTVVTVTDDDVPEHLTPESKRAELQAHLQSLKNRPIPKPYLTAAESPLRVIVLVDQKTYKLRLKR